MLLAEIMSSLRYTKENWVCSHLEGLCLLERKTFRYPHIFVSEKPALLKKNATVNHIFFSSLMQLYLCQLPIFIRKD